MADESESESYSVPKANPILEELHKDVYLGDGVYAYHDGFQIWLHTQQGMRIALEPVVLVNLVKQAQEWNKMIIEFQKSQQKKE